MRTESPQATERNGNSASSLDPKATIDADISGIEREFQKLVADIEHLIQSNTSLTGEDLVRAKAKLHARIADAKETVRRLGTPLIDRGRNVLMDTVSRVRAQPWQVIGITAGASLLIGYLVGRFDRPQSS